MQNLKTRYLKIAGLTIFGFCLAGVCAWGFVAFLDFLDCPLQRPSPIAYPGVSLTEKVGGATAVIIWSTREQTYTIAKSVQEIEDYYRAQMNLLCQNNPGWQFTTQIEPETGYHQRTAECYLYGGEHKGNTMIFHPEGWYEFHATQAFSITLTELANGDAKVVQTTFYNASC